MHVELLNPVFELYGFFLCSFIIWTVYDLTVIMILQQVSKLLALMHVVSALTEQVSLSSFSKPLGENYWASYFHQASIGTHLTYQFLSHLTGRCKVQPLVEAYLYEYQILWNFNCGFCSEYWLLKRNTDCWFGKWKISLVNLCFQ